MALPKGPVCASHVLVLPISHLPNAQALGIAGLRELARFKDALRRCFAAQGLSPLFWERNVPVPHQHLTVECVPLPRGTMATAKAALQHHAAKLKLQCDEVSTDHVVSVVQHSPAYLNVELEGNVSLLFPAPEEARRVLLNFARVAVAELLGCPSKADWRACQMSQDEEQAN